MCFSATASFTAGTALTALGGVTLSKVQKKTDILFAAIPLLFGIHQLIEGVIWVSFQNPKLLYIMTLAYLIFSHVLWPTLIPLAVLMMEKVRWRQHVLSLCLAVGISVSMYFLYFIITEPVQTVVTQHSIAYLSPNYYITLMLSSYSVATCASCLFSSHKYVRIFGLAIFLSALVAHQFYLQTFASVWCFFGALLSTIIYLHFRAEAKNQ